MAERTSTIDNLDPEILTGVVRRALCSATLEIGEWQHTPLTQRSFTPATTGGLHRVSGSGRDGARPLTWSVVLKVIQRPASPAAGELSHPDYWKREALAYESGLLDDLPVGLSAPRCFGTAEPAADVVWLWLEDITTPFGPQWPPDRLLRAARHLGRFNGAYLAERPLPTFPWLSRGWLRSWVETTCAPGFRTLEQPGLWDHPLIAPAFPRSTGARLQRLCAERERLLTALDQLPQTLCHWDAWRPNLFARSNAGGAAETGAIDWAFVGIGPVGTEIGQLVALDLLTEHVTPAGVGER